MNQIICVIAHKLWRDCVRDVDIVSRQMTDEGFFIKPKNVGCFIAKKDEQEILFVSHTLDAITKSAVLAGYGDFYLHEKSEMIPTNTILHARIVGVLYSKPFAIREGQDAIDSLGD